MPSNQTEQSSGANLSYYYPRNTYDNGVPTFLAADPNTSDNINTYTAEDASTQDYQENSLDGGQNYQY